MENRTFSRLLNRAWPLVVFSLPGVIVFILGVWVGWTGVIVFLDKVPPANYVGKTGLSVMLCVMGMLSFYAGLILSAVNDLHARLDTLR